MKRSIVESASPVSWLGKKLTGIMLPSFFTRLSLMVLGYAYPAYDCFKAVERSRRDAEQLRFWCQYWIILAAVTVAERVLDVTVSWLPLYPEAKVAFVVYLWSPQTKGASYIFSTFVRPLVQKHEPEIDRHLNEFRTKAGGMAMEYGQWACKYASERFVDILHYVATQTHPPRPAEPQTGDAINRSMSPKVKREQQQLSIRTPGGARTPVGAFGKPTAVSDDEDFVNVNGTVLDEIPTRDSYIPSKKDLQEKYARYRSRNVRGGQ